MGIQVFNIRQISDKAGYDRVKAQGYVGFANKYLQQCWNHTNLTNEADLNMFMLLVELDSLFGTTITEQVFMCVYVALRLDLIKVKYFCSIRKY